MISIKNINDNHQYKNQIVNESANIDSFSTSNQNTTSKIRKSHNIIATNNDGSKHIAIKVITTVGKYSMWKFVKQITIKRNNSNLFLVLVDLKENEINDYYVFKYDDFADKAMDVYNTYINTPNLKTGKTRKEISFRWYSYKNFSEEDFKLKNDWSLISSVFS